MSFTHLLINMKYTVAMSTNSDKTAVTIAATLPDDNGLCSGWRNMTRSLRHLHGPPMIIRHSWEFCWWRLPWTTSWMDATKEPLGKAEIVQTYKPASLFARSLMIRDCSWSATLPFRNVSWTFTPNWWWETRMMASFCFVTLNPHWTCVTLSFIGPGMNLHGKKTSCRRYPVTFTSGMILCAWKTAPKNRHKNYSQPFCCKVLTLISP